MQLYLPLASSMHNACFGIDILKIFVHKENRILQRLFSLGFFVGVFFSSEMYFFQVWPSRMSFAAFCYGEMQNRNCSLCCQRTLCTSSCSSKHTGYSIKQPPRKNEQLNSTWCFYFDCWSPSPTTSTEPCPRFSKWKYLPGMEQWPYVAGHLKSCPGIPVLLMNLS